MLDASALAVLQKAKNKIIESFPIKDGTVRATDKSFGFLEVDNNESYFIAPPDMKKVFHGDKVKARIRKDSNDREQAEPFELVTPFITRCVARLYMNHKHKMFYAKIDHPNYRDQIFAKVPNSVRNLNPKDGDWVIVELSDHPLLKPNNQPSVIVRELIARADDPKVPWLVSLRKYNLPTECPPDPDSLEMVEQYEHEDLTDLFFVTIDSPETKDMDDALYIEDHNEYWLLYVAIADPTAYIQPGSSLDKTAEKRAFTCYLPGTNIPIIPHVFSENICSILEGEKRSVLLAKIVVNKDGSVSNEPCTFSLANIRSHGKLAYNDISDYLENKENCSFSPDENLAKQLKIFETFALTRAKYRENQTISFKDKLDYHYVLNEKGALDHIEIEYRRIANRIVEEAMIVANEYAGSFLAKNLGFGIFNKHTGFDQDKLNQIIKILKANGIDDITSDELKTMSGYFNIRKKVSELPTGYLDMRLRKFQVPAEIVTAPAEHFGLGLKTYATWTSPIRKYGDMINHRIIKQFITGQHVDPKQMFNETTLEYLNLGKRTNRYAERDVKDWLNIEYIEPFINTKTIFEAIINDISRGGIKAVIIENGATVFIPMSLINPTKDEKIVANNEEGRIFNNGNVMFELAMKIKLTISEIDRYNRNIIASIAE